jgi:mRNA interferase RelE/StbE
VAYTITIKDSAQRELHALPTKQRRQIESKILALADNPRPQSAKLLKGGFKGLCRIRSGNYRVIYRIDDATMTLLVATVTDRKDAY